MLRRSIRIAGIQQLEPGLDPTQKISINFSQVCAKSVSRDGSVLGQQSGDAVEKVAIEVSGSR